MMGKLPEKEKPKVPTFKPTDAQARGYADRKIAATEANAQIGTAAIEQAGGVIRELISAAKSHPIVGIAVSVIAANVLRRVGVIDAKTEAFIFTISGVAFGVAVSLEVVEGIGAAISDINPFSGGGATAPDPSNLIRPSGTTLVENPPVGRPPAANHEGTAGGVGQLAALIPKAVPAA